MNRCRSCEKKFDYWPVWLSFWRGRIKCSSCGALNTITLDRRLLPVLITLGIPLILALLFRPDLTLFLSIVVKIVLFLILAVFFSLVVPFFKLYGD